MSAAAAASEILARVLYEKVWEHQKFKFDMLTPDHQRRWVRAVGETFAMALNAERRERIDELHLIAKKDMSIDTETAEVVERLALNLRECGTFRGEP